MDTDNHQHPPVATASRQLSDQIKRLAPEGLKRLELVETNAPTLSPEEIYTWINPTQFAHEIELHKAQPAETISAVRNVVILIPLTLTWLALALAAIEYLADVTNHHDDIYLPFLALWQSGFPNAHWPFTITLADVGIFDCLLLALIFLLTWIEQYIERQARKAAEQGAQELAHVTPALMARSARGGGRPIVGPDASVQDVANAIQAVIDQAFEQARQFNDAAKQRIQQVAETAQQQLTTVADSAQQNIQATQQAMEALLNTRLDPMLERMSKRLEQLQQQLALSQDKLDAVAEASQRLADAAGALQANAGAYMIAAQQISAHIEDLRVTQRELVGEIHGVGDQLHQSATALQNVADTLGVDAVTEVQQHVRETNALLQATTRALLQTNQRLATTANNLDIATQHLVDANLAGKRSGGDSFWRWLLGRD